jgi:hypothetical protein
MDDVKSSRFWSSVLPFMVFEVVKEAVCVQKKVIVRISTSNLLK